MLHEFSFDIPKAALTEISGSWGGGKTEVVLGFLAENPSFRVAWIEEDFTAYPNAFAQNNVALERVLFIESHLKGALWAALQILRSQIFQVVVMQAQLREEVQLRRLQLAAEKSQATVILLVEKARVQSTWPIAVQLEVSRSEQNSSPTVTPIKYRGKRRWLQLA